VIKNCSGQWQNNTDTIEEGSLAEFIIKERDAFGNVVCKNITKGEKQLVFKARILGIEKAYVSALEFKAIAGKSDDIQCGQLLTFPVLLYNLGQYRLEIKSGNQSIYGSPYPFNVVEGIFHNLPAVTFIYQCNAFCFGWCYQNSLSIRIQGRSYSKFYFLHSIVLELNYNRVVLSRQ
jgi:hypothetical protein